jgi:hypothetical protein
MATASNPPGSVCHQLFTPMLKIQRTRLDCFAIYMSWRDNKGGQCKELCCVCWRGINLNAHYVQPAQLTAYAESDE